METVLLTYYQKSRDMIKLCRHVDSTLIYEDIAKTGRLIIQYA